MREIAAFAVAALVLAGVGSIGKWNVGTIREAAAAQEAGLTFPQQPAALGGLDPFDLMANAKDLPISDYEDYSLVFHTPLHHVPNVVREPITGRP
jgi:hypothetical protein